jgi:hypothetical protein
MPVGVPAVEGAIGQEPLADVFELLAPNNGISGKIRQELVEIPHVGRA